MTGGCRIVLSGPASAGCAGAARAGPSWPPVSDVSSGGAGAGPGRLLVDSGDWSYEWAWARPGHKWGCWPPLESLAPASSPASRGSVHRAMWGGTQGSGQGPHHTQECRVLGVSSEQWAVSTSGVTRPGTSPCRDQESWGATCSVLATREISLVITTHGVTKCWDENYLESDEWQSLVTELECPVSCELGEGVCLS